MILFKVVASLADSSLCGRLRLADFSVIDAPGILSTGLSTDLGEMPPGI
jgi:hypothetical protein